MRNRAKCRVCGDTIESYHRTDYVMCSCGEIAIDGGDHSYKAYAKAWSNFLRVHDDGREVEVVVQGSDPVPQTPVEPSDPPKPTRKDMIRMLNDLKDKYDELPSQALSEPVTHYDMLSLLLLLSAIFGAEDAV